MRVLRPSEITSSTRLLTDVTPEQLAEAYKLAREAFTAEDLQRYTELDEGIPAEQVLEELERAEEELDGHDAQR